MIAFHPNKRMVSLLLAASLLALAAPVLRGQEQEIKPVTVGQVMPNFTLPAIQGSDVSLAQFKGKNVVIVFPRGFAAEGRWCPICNYQYAALAELEKKNHLRRKHHAEILFVFPYGKDLTGAWQEALPQQLEKIHALKNPAEPEKLDEAGKKRLERYRTIFAKDIVWKKGEAPASFPLLFDAERRVVKGLGLFATDWSGSKVEQDIPSVFIVDKKGVLAFKYVGQNPADRPSAEYVEKMLAFIDKH